MKNDKTKSVQQNMIYNTVGSLVYYFCQWVMTILIVRMSGMATAGILTLAMNTTAAPAIIGLFNIRSYQVSDLDGKYSDRTYVRARVCTNVISFLVCLAAVFINGYSFQKASVILMFMCFKLAEGAADVYYGIDQKNERLDYAGISLTIRGIGSLILFCVGLQFTGSLFFSVLFMSIFSFAVVLIYDRHVVKSLLTEGEVSFEAIKSLLLTCFPLAVVAFLNNLSLTIPRTYLERYFGEEILGYYGSVSSPTVVIQLAATTLFAPLVPILTMKYIAKDKKGFVETVVKFFAVIFGLTLLAIVASKFLARWALVLLFGEVISPYAYLFIPTVIIAVLIAVNASLFSICTLMRMIKQQYVIGVVGFAVSFILSITVVKGYSVNGIVWTFIGTLVVQIFIQLILVASRLKKMNDSL